MGACCSVLCSERRTRCKTRRLIESASDSRKRPRAVNFDFPWKKIGSKRRRYSEAKWCAFRVRNWYAQRVYHPFCFYYVFFGNILPCVLALFAQSGLVPKSERRLFLRPERAGSGMAVIERRSRKDLVFGGQSLGQPLRNMTLHSIPPRRIDPDEQDEILDRDFPNRCRQKFLDRRIVDRLAVPPETDLPPERLNDVAGKERGAMRIAAAALAFGGETVQHRTTDHRETDEDRAFDIVC